MNVATYQIEPGESIRGCELILWSQYLSYPYSKISVYDGNDRTTLGKKFIRVEYSEYDTTRKTRTARP